MQIPSLKQLVSAEEWQLRVDLAACYRLVALYGWSDLVFTHISARVPGPEHHFLINPYGLMFDEITASSLVKVDQQCNKLIDSPFPVNPAGFVIHSAVHEARDGCAVRAAHAHARRRSGERAAMRHPADFAAIDFRAGLAGVSRLRRRGVPRRGEAAPAGGPWAGQLPGAAQSRPVGGRHDHRRRLPADVHLREHLPHPAGRPGAAASSCRWTRESSVAWPKPCACRPAAWAAPSSGRH